MRGRITPPKSLAARAQLRSGPVYPRLRAETLEGRQRRVQLFAGCARLTAAPQSLAVGELCSGALPGARLTGVKLERGRVGLVDIGIVRHQRTTACSDRKRPGTLAFLRVLEQIGQLTFSLTRLSEPNLGFDEVAVEPEVIAQAVSPGDEHLGGGRQPLDRAGGVASRQRLESERRARPHDVPAVASLLRDPKRTTAVLDRVSVPPQDRLDVCKPGETGGSGGVLERLVQLKCFEREAPNSSSSFRRMTAGSTSTPVQYLMPITP